MAVFHKSNRGTIKQKLYWGKCTLYLGHVMSEMKKTFSIPEETETRVWSKFMENSKPEIFSNLDQTVLDAGLYQGQVLTVVVIS